MSGYRIESPARGARLLIMVNGRPLRAHEGESVHAALTASGVISLRADLHGRARGALCGMGVCFECRVTIDGVPDQRACMTPVREGMVIETGSGDQGGGDVAED